MSEWARDAVGYHFYPLGTLGAPHHNDGHSEPVSRLPRLGEWVDHLRWLGVDTVLLGPVWESSTHGYDTADLFQVDRRLGTESDLRALIDRFHEAGIRVLFDAVFHHVGRDHFAFRDLRERGGASQYRTWFCGVSFAHGNHLGDSFTYDAWNGALELVKLDVRVHEVREHLFAAARHWFERYGVDGLRLDAADVLDRDFQRDLAAVVREVVPSAWLLGEVIHGDYRDWAGPGRLDATTDYAARKGLYSAFNDGNLHEIAWTLDQHYGPAGRYQDLPLATFVDNHDVERVGSIIRGPASLYPLHLLLLSMPGVPFIYYGSEWGIEGRANGSDWPLRPALDWPVDVRSMPHPDLADTIARLTTVRHASSALRHGDYRQLHVAPRQLAFSRRAGDDVAVVAINASAEACPIDVAVDVPDGTTLMDALDPACVIRVEGGRLRCPDVPANWGRIFVSAR
ncbi:MAG TPA: alpha-amylase family glycosyl hydrolase [Thermomicrobiales bacterium]|jgi:glycosidase|nr:alpha-amylase family glycosyl hydrolase [Thermomicrobiales bacterium]